MAARCAGGAAAVTDGRPPSWHLSGNTYLPPGTTSNGSNAAPTTTLVLPGTVSNLLRIVGRFAGMINNY
jgi:hypothetical protein